MSKRTYKASLNQSQGRSGYTVIFRHPVRRDEATGKDGVRVRRGLGTRDEPEATQLCDQLNEILANPQFHDPSAKAEAERRFDSRVVDIFYYKMVPETIDFNILREKKIPLPTSDADGYRKVLFLGTTGAGKTTLVRQIIGTDPEKERFPSTSTAKTTIHDTEIVLDEGPWRAVVTFVSSDEVREYLNECISAAVLVASNKKNDDEKVLWRLLSHVNQRFRFNYIFGNGPQIGESDFDEDDEDDNTNTNSIDEFGAIDITATNDLLTNTVNQLRDIANRLSDRLHEELNASKEEDERVLEELFEEELDNMLRDEEEYHQIADALMDEIEKRFDLLPQGNLKKNKQGWPLAWSGEWSIEQREEFLKAISRFSSNYAPLFGRLLTPLVNGVRVAGPFSPCWDSNHVPKLVLLDGEGLGHTPKSSSSVSTTVSRNIEKVDAVILVDNAAQPMQAAPLAAMREVVSTGNSRKLILAFTHFDEIEGDNLPDLKSKGHHVLASAENVLASFGEELGPYAERALRNRLENARFFLENIQKPLSEDNSAGKRTIKHIKKLLEAIDLVIERPEPVEARPVYDRMNLGFAIQSAAEAYQEAWRPRLGLEFKPGFIKEHWTRVKALSRRLATGMADEYDTLKPVADLRKELVERIYVFIQNPLRWEGPDAIEEKKISKYDALADNIGKRLLDLSTRRVWRERAHEWQNAYYKRGTCSTFVRARIIGDDIYKPAAPVPDVTPSPDRNQFLREVVSEIEAAAEEIGAKLI